MEDRTKSIKRAQCVWVHLSQMKPSHLDFHKPTHEQLQIELEKNYLAMGDMFGLFMLHEIDGSINMYT